ncbi:hypothetical protein M514_06726 [Trichuris suis]|uniref:Uncharacterized protein n=1 Tax=Trichuris suis TaxID=68888 RepID=A0A085NKD6_9BILA|nr:hypothetical protein M513_06726 [Trichuris suis]KFD69932.1 hypothetical protein M514_06726 [Trichuris suis]
MILQEEWTLASLEKTRFNEPNSKELQENNNQFFGASQTTTLHKTLSKSGNWCICRAFFWFRRW